MNDVVVIALVAILIGMGFQLGVELAKGAADMVRMLITRRRDSIRSFKERWQHD